MPSPYIVWSPEGETPPKVSYETHGKACAIAWHMAKLNPGQKFFVMGRAGLPALVEREEIPDAA
jgi:hypothetical protein